MPSEAYKWATQDPLRDQVKFLEDDSFSTKKHCCKDCEEGRKCADNSPKHGILQSGASQPGASKKKPCCGGCASGGTSGGTSGGKCESAKSYGTPSMAGNAGSSELQQMSPQLRFPGPASLNGASGTTLDPTHGLGSLGQAPRPNSDPRLSLSRRDENRIIEWIIKNWDYFVQPWCTRRPVKKPPWRETDETLMKPCNRYCREKFRKAAKLICFADRHKATFMSGFHMRRAAAAFLDYLRCCQNAGHDLWDGLMDNIDDAGLFDFKEFGDFMVTTDIWTDKQAHFFAMCSYYVTSRADGHSHMMAHQRAMQIAVGFEFYQNVLGENDLLESLSDMFANQAGVGTGKHIFDEFGKDPKCGKKCLVRKCGQWANRYSQR